MGTTRAFPKHVACATALGLVLTLAAEVRADETAATPTPARGEATALVAAGASSGQSALAPTGDGVIIVPESQGVVVSASRAGLEPRAVGSAYTVVEQEDLQRAQSVLVRESLQDIPGITAASTRPGVVGAVNIRGSDNEQILVLIDGIELGDPSLASSQYQMEHLTTLDVARIEVLRGNQSSLYGSDAIGGVINIVTQKATEDGYRLNLEGEGGSYGTRRGGASLLGRQGIVDFRLTLQGQAVDGPSLTVPLRGPADEDDRAWQYNISGRVGVQLLPSLLAEVMGFHRIADQDLDGTGQDATFSTNSDKNDDAIALRLTHDAWDGRWTNQLTASWYETDRRFYGQGQPVDGDVYQGAKRNINLVSTIRPVDIVRLVAGFDLEREETDQVTAFSGNFTADNETNSGFGEVALEPVRNLTLTGAVRHDDNRRFGGYTTWRGTAAYYLADVAPGTDVKLRGSYGTGAKAPSLFQLFDPTYGNALLQVEESEGWDVGVDVFEASRDIALELTWFETDVTSEIDFDFAAGGYIQRGETRNRGVELGLTAQPLDWLRVQQSYTFLLNDDLDLGARVGKARHVGMTMVTVSPLPDLDLSLRARYRSANEASFAGRTDGFVTFDVLASYHLTADWELYGRVVNVLDKDYQTVAGQRSYGLSAFVGFRTSLDVGALAGL
ncbi:TonB-dependent receptor [Zavarzinia sp. CC-PAN008]|uniref:TonB-dependent receptor n=1 Tax=Zavarzinia sp. CC-PAN008 TaxID=3243332 RepID=UPI003F74210B